MLQSYAVESTQGPYLNINEDNALVNIKNSLFAVIDGYGGSGIGDVGSLRIKEELDNFYTRISGDIDSTLPFYYSNKFLIEGNALINALKYIHVNIYNDNIQKDISSRFGASIAAAAMSENILTLSLVGNVECGIGRNGKVKKITTNDSLDNYVSNLQSLNETSPMSGIGLFEDLHLHTIEFRIYPGDLVYLMTDGAFGKLKFRELETILMSSHSLLSDKITRIFEENNDRGNLDNQTIILLQF